MGLKRISPIYITYILWEKRIRFRNKSPHEQLPLMDDVHEAGFHYILNLKIHLFSTFLQILFYFNKLHPTYLGYLLSKVKIVEKKTKKKKKQNQKYLKNKYSY